MASHCRGRRLSASFSHHRRNQADEFVQLAGRHEQSTVQFDLSRKIDESRAGHSGSHLARGRTPAAQHAAAAFLSKGEPRRAAHLLPRAQFGHGAAVHHRRVRRDAHRAAALHGLRRFARAGVRRAEVRRARAGGPRPARRAPDRHRRGAARHFASQHQPPHRPPGGRPAGVHHHVKRPADQRSGLPAAHRRVPQWRAHSPGTDRPRD